MSGAVWRGVKANFALIVVVVTFCWSVVAIFSSRQHESGSPDAIVLRIGHWQLEAGVREGLNAMAAKYHALHPEVTIVQDAIPEGTYGQWMTTQLMGGTAPDMMQVGLGGAVPYNVMLGYYNRYFLPMTALVNQPNPYNKGTALEGMSWRSTYKDTMRAVYIEELQEYMMIPLSQFGVRVFYNRDLLRRLTGLSQPPHDYRQFLAVCERIHSQIDERGKPYTPIAGSAYHVGMWDGFMSDPLTYGAIRKVDFNRDGSVGNDELFTGFKTGVIDFGFEPFVGKFRMLRQLTGQFQPGFTGLGRDEAVFLFAQQHAVFITTGTWDVGGLYEQAKEGGFQVGIMDFPAPSQDDPEFGKIAEGPVYERPSSAFSFVVTRTSRHPDVAIDFLRFIGSQKGNQELNEIIGWIPAVKDTQVSPMLQPFNPHLEGIFGAMPVTLGGETWIKWQQLFSLYQVNQLSYEEMTREFLPFYLESGVQEWEEMNRNRRRGMAADEQFLAGVRATAAAADASQSASRWIKYRQMTSNRVIQRDLFATYLQNRLNAGVASNAVGPYGFRPEVLERVRAQVLAKGAKGN